jgi:hypothetical protein
LREQDEQDTEHYDVAVVTKRRAEERTNL